MTITVQRTGGVRDRIEKLANVKALVEEVAKQLCEVGEPIIRATHGNHARVWTEPTENGYKISAEGEDVLFIEFGTGDRAGVLSPWYDEVPAETRPGSWSESHAQMYSKHGFWVFGGQIYHYTEPHPAFYDAYQAMVEALPKITQEVFGK